MPRLPRLNLPGQFFHIMARGIEKRKIFRKSWDYEDFLARLARLLERSGCVCYAWALMPNHFHLLILSGVQGMVSLMHPLLTGYAASFNRRYDRVGHLFQNRYKAILCESEPYFLELVRYIHLNPVRGGLVSSLQELARYPWVGHAALLGKIALPWQETAEVLSRFGNSDSEARERYSQFVQDGWGQGTRDDLEGGGLRRSLGGLGLRTEEKQAFDARILGSSDFVERILHDVGMREVQFEVIRKQVVTMQQLQSVVGQLMGVSENELIQPGRKKRVSEAKSLLIYAGKEFMDRSGKEMAELTHMTPPSASVARRRGEQLAGRMDFVAHLEKLITKNVPRVLAVSSDRSPAG